MAFGNYTVASEGLDSKQGEEKMFFFVFHHPHAALRLHFFYWWLALKKERKERITTQAVKKLLTSIQEKEPLGKKSPFTRWEGRSVRIRRVASRQASRPLMIRLKERRMLERTSGLLILSCKSCKVLMSLLSWAFPVQTILMHFFATCIFHFFLY